MISAVFRAVIRAAADFIYASLHAVLKGLNEVLLDAVAQLPHDSPGCSAP